MINATGIMESQLNIEESELKKLSNMNFKNKREEELMAAASQFEAVFVNQLFKALDATVERDRDGMFSGGKGEEMFKSMLHDEMAKDISSNPATSFGFAKQIYEQMKNVI